MVKIEIRIQGVVRDNIVCKWVTKEQLAFLRTLEDDNWAFKGERPNLKITIISKYVMIDDKKIEEAARYYCNNRYPASQDAPFIAEGV